MKKLVLCLFSAFLTFYAQAQVGINVQAVPNEQSMLDIQSSASQPRGVLFPRLSSLSVNNFISFLTMQEQSGMMVYDTTLQHLIVYKPLTTNETTSFSWHIMDPWLTNSGSIFLSDTVENVGIGTDTPEEKLHVKGTVKADIVRSDEIDSEEIKTGFITNAESDASKTLEVKGNLSTDQKISAGEFVGNGTIPVGGIIMWSGSEVPKGWALCDGVAVFDDNGNKIEVPDLRGRFIIGAGKYVELDSTLNFNSGTFDEETDSTTYTYHVNDKGGISSHRLGEAELPANTVAERFVNQSTINIPDDAPDDFYEVVGKYTIVGLQPSAISNVKVKEASKVEPNNTYRSDWPHYRDFRTTGRNIAHENRPPYYVLAFIMRIK